MNIDDDSTQRETDPKNILYQHADLELGVLAALLESMARQSEGKERSDLAEASSCLRRAIARVSTAQSRR